MRSIGEKAARLVVTGRRGHDQRGILTNSGTIGLGCRRAIALLAARSSCLIMVPVAICLSLALGGCQTATTPGAALVHPELPPLPPAVSTACPRPVSKIGDDLGVIGLKWKATAICESGKRSALITFYTGLRKRLGAK